MSAPQPSFWLNIDPKTCRARLHVDTCKHAIEKGAKQNTEKPVGRVIARSQGGWQSFFDMDSARREVATNWPKLNFLTCKDCLSEAVPAIVLPASDLDYAAPERSLVTVHRVIRDTEVSRYIKQLHNYRCQICGEYVELANGAPYAEAHHIRPLGHKGPDHPNNILCVCPNHHVQLDYFAIRLDLTTLRLEGEHRLDQRFIDYHNEHYRQNEGERSASPQPMD